MVAAGLAFHVYEAGVTPSLNETMVAAGLAVAWD
jgi:hypothetical protein